MGDNDRERHLYDSGFALTQRIGPWSVLMEWPMEAEQGPHRIEIRPAEDAGTDEVAGGLSSTVLLQVDFQMGKSEFRKLVEQTSTLNRAYAVGMHPARLRELVGQGISDAYLAHLAQAYVDLVRLGEQSVTAKLAEMVGKSPETIRQHDKRVRKAGFLTTITGKAGGRLTDKAYAVLRNKVADADASDKGCG